jgi:hypothetical protein
MKSSLIRPNVILWAYWRIVAVGFETRFGSAKSCLSDEDSGDGRPGRSVTRRKGFARRFFDRIDTRRLIGHSDGPFESLRGSSSVNQAEPVDQSVDRFREDSARTVVRASFSS